MEGAAVLFNDCLLALDEISECDPREVGNIVYALGNGRGKQRAGRTGAARAVTRWQAFIVSTGERTIATTMAEGGHRSKAGQSVRLLDIPTARKQGCFDVLHDHTSGAALSDAIKRAAVTHYGRAGRAFLERLTHDQRDFAALLERLKGLPDFNRQDFEGQDKRAAGRFALLALAGELATEYGLTGWPEGEAVNAAVIVFNAWRSILGRGNDERRQILERVSDFIERHGDGRFSCADDTLGVTHEVSGVSARGELPTVAADPIERDLDDRRFCTECLNLRSGVCTVARPGGVVSAIIGYRPASPGVLQRCAGYSPNASDTDQPGGLSDLQSFGPGHRGCSFE